MKRGADCASDHYLIVNKIRLKLRKAPKGKELGRKKYDIQKLRDKKTRDKFSTEIKNRFELFREMENNNENIGKDVNKIWDNIKNIYVKHLRKCWEKETTRENNGYRMNLEKHQ